MGLVGKIALGVVGGAIGYFTGGLGFILMGATIGYGLGEMIDPTMADTPSIGEPKISKLEVSTCEEGLPIPDALGTQKIVGNIFWYANSRSVRVTEEVESGGKGGGSSSETVTVGWKYYLTWAVGLVTGPIDEMFTVYRFDKPVWTGNSLRSAAVNGEVSITLEDMGSMTLYFGTTDQLPNSLIGADVGDNVNPPLRGFCYAIFNDCLVGEYNRAPTMKFVFRKTPVFSFSLLNRIGLYDYNPAHAIYYIMITMLGLPTTWINETSFGTFATALAHEDEQRGMSLLFADYQAAMNYIESILTHVGGMVYYGTDGKWHAGLIRDDVDIDDMIEIVEDNIVKPMTLTPNTYVNTLNDIKVQYPLRFDLATGLPAPGAPDVYNFSFCDESTSNSYTISYSDWTPHTNWYTDYAAAQVERKWLRTGSRWIGFMGHIGDASGFQNSGSNVVVPDGYTTGASLLAIGVNYFTVPYSSPTGNEAIDAFLANLPAGGYRPGSWFVFNRDITISNDATQLANGAAQLANLKAYLTAQGYIHTTYTHEETNVDERWLNWLLTSFDY